MSKQTMEMMRKGGSAEPATAQSEHQQIEALAYQLWLQRGCPAGSDQEDWFQAEEQVRSRQRPLMAA